MNLKKTPIKKSIEITAFLICLFVLFFPIKTALAFTLPQPNYPRLVNLYWKTPITKEEARQLARWDMLALDMQAQTDGADNIKYIRRLNPKIIILAYTSSNEIPVAQLKIKEPSGAGLWHDLEAGLKPQWQLKTYDGFNISWWPGNISMNLYPADDLGRTYADYLTDFYKNKVLATGLWDGLLFDNTWQDVAWVNPNIDIDGDGQKDTAAKINTLWQSSYQNFFQKLRNELDGKYLIIGNGDGTYYDYLNGRMMEGFPEFYEGGWTGSMTQYRQTNNYGYTPRVNIINSDTENTGNYQDYRAMRYGLASAMLFDGYYSFDYGTALREQLWWYDEYDAKLGNPKSEPFNLLNKQGDFSSGVWQRDFANGLILVNSTNDKQKIDFDAEYEKIHGSQDPQTNDGAKINEVEIKPQDGIILYRPIKEIKNNVYINGSFARIFNNEGKNIRTGFFAYDQKFRGQNKIIKSDINNDGQMETVVADNNSVSIYGELEKIKTIFPYGRQYNKGISLALADLDGDQKMEIITGSEGGGANLIKIFNWYGNPPAGGEPASTSPKRGEPMVDGWNAYNKIWKKLGVHIAVGDINGDGQKEIITGAGMGGGPHVRIFDKNGKLQLEFFAYSAQFRGGVNVAVGDINGDGLDEIITGAGAGGGPHVRIFDGQGKLLNEWFAYKTTKRDGVDVVASDIDGDGKDEILGLTTAVFTTSFKNNNNDNNEINISSK